MSADLDDWIRLCQLLDDDPELIPAVRGAVEEGADAWTALLDDLDDAGVLAYLQEDDTGVELADALPQLPRVFATGADLDEVGDVEGGLDVAVARADGILTPHGLRLVYLDERSEAYPLVAVPAENAEPIIEITTRLGFSARVFS